MTTSSVTNVEEHSREDNSALEKTHLNDLTSSAQYVSRIKQILATMQARNGIKFRMRATAENAIQNWQRANNQDTVEATICNILMDRATRCEAPKATCVTKSVNLATETHSSKATRSDVSKHKRTPMNHDSELPQRRAIGETTTSNVAMDPVTKTDPKNINLAKSTCDWVTENPAITKRRISNRAKQASERKSASSSESQSSHNEVPHETTTLSDLSNSVDACDAQRQTLRSGTDRHEPLAVIRDRYITGRRVCASMDSHTVSLLKKVCGVDESPKNRVSTGRINMNTSWSGAHVGRQTSGNIKPKSSTTVCDGYFTGPGVCEGMGIKVSMMQKHVYCEKEPSKKQETDSTTSFQKVTPETINLSISWSNVDMNTHGQTCSSDKQESPARIGDRYLIANTDPKDDALQIPSSLIALKATPRRFTPHLCGNRGSSACSLQVDATVTIPGTPTECSQTTQKVLCDARIHSINPPPLQREIAVVPPHEGRLIRHPRMDDNPHSPLKRALPDTERTEGIRSQKQDKQDRLVHAPENVASLACCAGYGSTQNPNAHRSTGIVKEPVETWPPVFIHPCSNIITALGRAKSDNNCEVAQTSQTVNTRRCEASKKTEHDLPPDDTFDLQQKTSSSSVKAHKTDKLRECHSSCILEEPVPLSVSQSVELSQQTDHGSSLWKAASSWMVR